MADLPFIARCVAGGNVAGLVNELHGGADGTELLVVRVK